MRRIWDRSGPAAGRTLLASASSASSTACLLFNVSTSMASCPMRASWALISVIMELVISLYDVATGRATPLVPDPDAAPSPP